MKILFITDLFPVKSGETTTPVTLHNFVNDWIKQGHNVDVIKPNFIFNSFLRGKPFYKTETYEFNGIKIFNVNYFTPFWFNFLRKIPKEFYLKHYDAIIAHMPSGIIFGDKLINKTIKTGANVKFVCGVHYSDIEVLTNPIYKFYFSNQLQNAYKRADKIACRSFVLQKKFIELMPELADKTFVAPSGIDEEVWKLGSLKAHKKQNLQTSKPLCLSVLTCANLIKRKNIDKLILAIKDLEDFELNIIGDGKELKHLKKLNVTLNLIQGRISEPSCNEQPKVKFLGRLLHDKVLQEMQKADIFILPSVRETFGMVYLEALASGCITVCTKGDGIDGIIKDSENGFLTDPTVDGIKETLLRIKNYENKEEIIKNSLNAVKKYSQETCAKNYLENLIK